MIDMKKLNEYTGVKTKLVWVSKQLKDGLKKGENLKLNCHRVYFWKIGENRWAVYAQWTTHPRACEWEMYNGMYFYMAIETKWNKIDNEFFEILKECFGVDHIIIEETPQRLAEYLSKNILEDMELAIRDSLYFNNI